MADSPAATSQAKLIKLANQTGILNNEMTYRTYTMVALSTCESKEFIEDSSSKLWNETTRSSVKGGFVQHVWVSIMR